MKKFGLTKLKKSFITVLIIFVVACVSSFYVYSVFNKKEVIDIQKTLKSASYSYLPKEAKNYIQRIYEETGEVILTEKNKEENVPYLNPDFVDYISMTDKQKESIALVPDTYILDYEVSDKQENLTFPTSYDLRNIDGKNFVSPIKDQGSTSLCWIFASVQNAETLLMKKNNQSFSDLIPSFSIRQMDYVTATEYLVKNASWISCSGNCSWDPWKNPDNGARKLGAGGNFFLSSIIMANGLTLTDESILPWSEENNPKWPKDIMGYDKSLYEVNSTIVMPSLKTTASVETRESYVLEVKKNIVQYGGPYVSTYSPQSTCGFNNIDGRKMLKTDDCVEDSDTKTRGHAMQIIGWDDNYEYSYCDAGTKHYSVSNGKCSSGVLTTGKGAWILKNSWGEKTQTAKQYSYVYLTYDSTKLSIGFTTSISEMKNRTWDNNYHANPWLDQDMSNGMVSVKSQTIQLDTKNTKSEKVEKIKFFTSSKNGKYNLSIISGDKSYNNITTVNTTDAGIYTIELSDKNIVLNTNEFLVKVESTNGGVFYNNSISVFTSNISNDDYVVTYSSDGYDSTKPLSNENPLYIDLYHNTYYDTYSWENTTILSSYLKNLPQYSELKYRLKKNSVTATYFGESDIHYEGDIAVGEFKGSSATNVNFNLKNEHGETWIMEIVNNNEVVNSFPIKFNTDKTKSHSNVRLYANNGTDYYYDYSAIDREINKFESLNGNVEFYNKGYYIKSWNTKADGTGTSYSAEEGVFVHFDTVLYAQWSTEKISAKVVYVGQEDYCSNCISGSVELEVYGYDDYIQFPINKFTKENHVFNKWKINFDKGSFEYYYEQEKLNKKMSEILKYPVFNNTEVIVYATWLKDYVTVSFDANGGSGSMTNINVMPNTSSMLKNNLYQRKGYLFGGWNTKEDGTGISYSNGQWINFSESQTLYAQWVESDLEIKDYVYNQKNNYITNIKEQTKLSIYKTKFEMSSNYQLKVYDRKNIELNEDNLIFTGSITKVIKDGKVINELVNIVKGDVTGDGIVNIADVIKIADHTLSNNILDSYEKEASEVTNDTILNIADVLKIADYTLNKKIEILK